MTSWIPIQIGKKKVIAKAGGYTGKNEAKTPRGDVITANRIWLSKEQRKELKLGYGKKVTIKVGGVKKTGRVLRWSRGSAQIVFTRAGLPRRTPVYTTRKAPEYVRGRVRTASLSVVERARRIAKRRRRR